MDVAGRNVAKHPGSHEADSPDNPIDDDSMGDGESPTQEKIRQHDFDTLNAEEEAERLLGATLEHNNGGRSIRRPRHRNPRRLEEGKDSASSSTSSSVTSSQEDMRRTSRQTASVRKTGVSSCGRFAALYVVICAAFLALLYGAFSATARTSASSASPYGASRTRSNGTHEFRPTTILISLDGFRADFVHRGLTPSLSSLVEQGVSPKWMFPSFPSLTFPNHYTLVTGLYPESHGIVGNSFFDPLTQKEFYYTDPARSMTPEWWNAAEPLWEAAEQHGIPAAVHMWPGSEANIGDKQPAYIDKYKAHEVLQNKVDRILGWLDLPGPGDEGASDDLPRPQLIAAYVPDVDKDGHVYGPNSTYIRSTIAQVDGMMGSLLKGLNYRNLTDVVNIVIVSDHGMATTSNHRLIQLEDLVDPAIIEHTDGWPLFGLRPYNQTQPHLEALYEDLLAKSQLPKHRDQFDVYMRDFNMPERYHFSQNQRIAPLWIVPRVGWAITPKHEFDLQEAPARGEVWHPRGLHGYDHQHPLMRAIFIARGPAFPHPHGSEVEPFQNTEVYNIVCDSLGLQPKRNNGTIRLPFTVSGLHDPDAEAMVLDNLDDFDIGSVLLPPGIPEMAAVPPVDSARLSTVDISTAPEQSSGSPDTGKNAAETPDIGPSSWLEWANGKLQAVKTWATDLFGSHKMKSLPKTDDSSKHV